MKTLIQKDLRENFKLAVFGLLVLVLILWHAVAASQQQLDKLLRQNFSVEASQLQPLLSSQMLEEVAGFCGLFGILLGWLQTRNEAHRDLWAFLIHRPVTRTTIFWSKALAGLGLYGLAVGLPLAGMVVYVQIPGHVAAPFEWAMALPLVKMFLVGLSAYLIGLLTGLRQARWFASKGLGVGLVWLVFAAAFFASPWWLSYILVALGIGLAGLAAWGAYQSGGYYQGQPMAGKLALLLSITAGCCVVLFAGLACFAYVVVPAYRLTEYSYYQVTRSGNVYEVVVKDNENRDILDLDGQLLLDSKTRRKADWRKFQQQAAVGITANAQRRKNFYQNSDFQNTSYFSLWSVADKVLWYLDRQGKLICFDSRTRCQIGTLTATAPFVAPSAGFFYNSPNGGETHKFIATTNTIYQVDLLNRSFKPVQTLTNDEVLGYAQSMDIYGVSSELLFTTHQFVGLLQQEGDPEFMLPYEPRYSNCFQISVYHIDESTNNRFVLCFVPAQAAGQRLDPKKPEHFVWLGQNPAEVTRTLDRQLTKSPEAVTSRQEKCINAFMPSIFILVESGSVYFHEHVFRYSQPQGIPVVLGCVLIGWGLIRRYRFSPGVTVGWLLWIALFGVAGLMALLCVPERPAREECPHCKKLRAVNREHCEHCAAPFPEPARNGTEIFAPLVKPA